MPNERDKNQATGHHHHDHDCHDHDHNHEEDDMDPALQEGWEALEAGDVEAARAAARAAIDSAGAPAPGPKGRRPPVAASGDEDERARLIDGLLLEAACGREEGDDDAALNSLTRIVKEDPEWCTPELWIAEILADDEERRDEALRHARRALDLAEEEGEYLAALALKATVELDLGRPAEARRTLEGLPPADVALDDPLATLQFADLLMDAEDLPQARVRLETLTAASPELADGWYALGLCAELQGDEETQRKAWLKTRALDLAQDPEEQDGGAPTRLTEDGLVTAAEEALGELPEDLRKLLENVPIVVAEVPAEADVAGGLDPRLLGLFSGSPHAESGGVMSAAELTEIVLFRRNIERISPDEETVRDEVRVTLLHEAGHFFGLDEADLARLGLD